MLSRIMCFTMIYAQSFKNAVRYQKKPTQQKKQNYRKRFCEKPYTFTRGCFFCCLGVSHEPNESAERFHRSSETARESVCQERGEYRQSERTLLLTVESESAE